MSEKFIARRMKRVRPSPTGAIADTVRAMEAAGLDVINLGLGELDFATPPAIGQAGIDAIARGDTKYTAVAGTLALRQAIADKFQRDNGLSYQPAEIIAGTGAKQLIFNAFMATLSPGDEVIIPAPYWVSYPDMVALAEGETRIVACSEASGWKLRPEELRAAITPRTRWLVLNSPNNPTGAVYCHRELAALAAVLVEAPQVLVLSDDIYERLRHQDEPFATLAAVEPRLRDRTLTVNGLSKGFSMTGWRLGYAGGPGWLIAAMQVLQSQSTSNPSSVSQAAALTALTAPDDFTAGWLARLAARRAIVMAMIDQVEGLSAQTPPGAFYVFACCGGLLGKRAPDGALLATDGDVADYLARSARVATLQGAAFGMSPYIRIAYALDDQRLSEACERIKQACARLR
ncbi:pyridoxal phosphate-dependent aminotransferase [Sodalis sp. C49]|uniref:pyridoxal phosphate-dependent aminotransferase n=1 Tax=Sodalis sp. C49 TaxID=3228929 RepID=UPI0039658E7B